jgi:Fe-Mn family superoxide dismutase
VITLPKLPWEHSALEPNISKETIHYHYDKHHKAYVDNLNKLIKGTEYEDMELTKIITKSESGPIFNNAAQVWNHTFYWNSMTPTKKFESLETGKLYDAIMKQWKTFEAFEKEFGEKGKKLFGSGWVWLTSNNGKLNIEVTHNANGPKHKPLIVCDKWEHAWYLDYQNDVVEYMKHFFKIVNWKFANENFTST